MISSHDVPGLDICLVLEQQRSNRCFYLGLSTYPSVILLPGTLAAMG